MTKEEAMNAAYDTARAMLRGGYDFEKTCRYLGIDNMIKKWGLTDMELIAMVTGACSDWKSGKPIAADAPIIGPTTVREPSGKRLDTLFREGYVFVKNRRLTDRAAIRDALADINRERFQEPVDDASLESVTDSIMKVVDSIHDAPAGLEDLEAPATEEPADAMSRLTQTMRLLDATRRERAEMEDNLKTVVERQGELDASVIAQAKALGITQLPRLEGCGTFTLANRYDYKVDPENKHKITEWIKEIGHEELLSVNYQTLQSFVKQRLENGEDVPDFFNLNDVPQVRWSRR